MSLSLLAQVTSCFCVGLWLGWLTRGSLEKKIYIDHFSLLKKVHKNQLDMLTRTIEDVYLNGNPYDEVIRRSLDRLDKDKSLRGSSNERIRELYASIVSELDLERKSKI